MAAWTLTPALAELRGTFDRRCPNRDTTSDGSIGDAAHAGRVSSHNPDETGAVPVRDADAVNEVHAIDLDEDLRASDARGPFTMLRAVRRLVEDHRTGREDRLRYIIYEATIWSASWGWAAREYTGANPHDKHAHCDGSYDTAKERDTSPWNIGFVEDDDMQLTDKLFDNAGTYNGYSINNALVTLLHRIPVDLASLKPLIQQAIQEASDDPEVPVTLTAEQVTALADGVAARMPAGPSLDELRGVVDEELDEQSRAGADADAP